jgi:glycosyl transferase family 2/glycosyl transferase family 1
MHFCFVSTRRGSYFMTELLMAISAAVEAAGHTTELALDDFPPLRGDCVYVVIPHEFHAWGNPGGFPDARQRARTIALCTENPGTEWFEATYELVPELAAAVSINRSSARELQRRGIRCEHLQLGYSPLWDTWHRDGDVERPIDVLYLGAADPRRDPLLARLGRELCARECQLLVPPLELRTRPRPDFLKGGDKYNRLRSSKILLNLHRTTSSALEWMRFLEAICNGCVVVSEPCLDNEPLLPDEHFVSASVDDIGRVIDDLLDDQEELRRLRQRAYDFVRDELPMGSAADRFAQLAAELPRQPQVEERLWSVREVLPSADQSAGVAAPSEETPRRGEPLFRVKAGSKSRGVGRPRWLRRNAARMRPRGRTAQRILSRTPAYAQATPRVTVLSVVPPDGMPEQLDAIASVAASVYGDFEVLILDEGENAGMLRRFLDDRPSVPALLLQQPSASSVGQSRNALAEHARGEYLFILDAEGVICPLALTRLVKALDVDPFAMFSYPMVGVFDGADPVELRSSLPWEPERLGSGNWIDAMALIRREHLLELGGYSTDPRLAGWEDFELWCKCADVGGHGVHLPEVLAWRQQRKDPGTPEMWALMRERYPRLLRAPNAV